MELAGDMYALFKEHNLENKLCYIFHIEKREDILVHYTKDGDDCYGLCVRYYGHAEIISEYVQTLEDVRCLSSELSREKHSYTHTLVLDNAQTIKIKFQGVELV